MASLTKDRVLSWAQTLWELRGYPRLDVDLVDAVFYYELCRRDLRDTFVRLAGAYLQADAGQQAELEGPLNEHLLTMEAQGPGFRAWLERRQPPMMRAPLFSWQPFTPINIPRFEEAGRFRLPADTTRNAGIWTFLGVRNGRWRGKQVERALREHVRGLERAIGDSLRDDPPSTLQPASTLMPDESVIAIDLKFYGARELQMASSWSPPAPLPPMVTTIESPVIMVTASYPLPPEAIITSAFDAIAIDEHGWNERLYGAGATQNQGVEVAIRTWTMGLLTGLGRSWREVDAVQNDLFFPQVISQAGFSADRQELLRRVPEARPFVFHPSHPAKGIQGD